MPGKLITPEGLEKDVTYTIGGIDCHSVLFDICHPEPGLKILEPGCGSGKLSMAYAMRGAETFLLDIDPGVLAYTQALKKLVMQRLWEQKVEMDFEGMWKAIHLLNGSIHALSFADNTFDFVFNEGVPQHWPDEEHRQGAINEMVRVSKRWVCVIGSNARCSAMRRYADVVPHTYMGMPSTQVPWFPEELSSRLEGAGLQNVRVEPVRENWEDSMLLAGWGRKKEEV